MERTLQKLKTFNLIMGAFHLIQSLAMLFLASSVIQKIAEFQPEFDRVSWFVWAIVGTYFVAFNTFPINMILQHLRVGKWKNYLYGERTYIILSLAAKSFLAWLVLFSAMQP